MINDYQKYLNEVDLLIKDHLNKNDVSSKVKESSLYSISAGGKKIRPLLLFKTLKALNFPLESGVPVAATIEMIHTYSLIHDDLPAMDNDDYRRGKLTNHKVYGEATAILAGDNLLTESIHLLSYANYNDAIKIKLIQLITSAAGQFGMISGQMNDILSANKEIDYKTLENIHRYKTGKLIQAPVVAAAMIAGASNDIINNLNDFSGELGLLFQIKDDLLDVQGTQEELGKSVGTDEKNQTTTYVSLFGVEGAMDLLKEKETETKRLLYKLKDDIDIIHLEDIISIVVNRTK
ncbi:polyprenyl synthetase family protein [Nosocomiicoccus ampullae]|uniref:polyprenyl synthetase family protein n=1 Tax=Nosocomiicoccus ampullae TaxID=489910 RepID=UPI001C5F1160|nr:farnesyl diphosphate synthase [Nosocomiicoccus ampullae]QYA49243.1 polyprenyl synthetase family protein [Nosocomiicoccus ampullae]